MVPRNDPMNTLGNPSRSIQYQKGLSPPPPPSHHLGETCSGPIRVQEGREQPSTNTVTQSPELLIEVPQRWPKLSTANTRNSDMRLRALFRHPACWPCKPASHSSLQSCQTLCTTKARNSNMRVWNSSGILPARALHAPKTFRPGSETRHERF